MTDTATKVAVVVVHGVADQLPHESVAHVANLLANVDDAVDGTPVRAYGAFVAEPAKIAVRAVPASPSPPPSGAGGPVRRLLRRIVPPAATPSFYDLCEPPPPSAAHIDAGHLFTDAVLRPYARNHQAETYDTIRLRTTRRGRGAEDPIDVDLFEMYWADQSRVGTSWWRILGELYQVLLHLPSLGKHAASAAVANTSSLSGWIFQSATAVGAWILSTPILVFNVFFLTAAVMVLAGLIPEGRHRPIATVLAASVVIGVVQWLWLTLAHRRLVVRLGASAAVAGVAAVPFILWWGDPEWPSRLLGLEMLGIGLLLIAAPLLRSYAKHRPGGHNGTRHTSVAAALIVLCTAVAAMATPVEGASWFRYTSAVGFRIAEVVAMILFGWWSAFFLLGLYPSVAAGIAYARGGQDGGRAVRTARVSLAIPAAALLILTVSLWAGLFWAIDRQNPAPFDQSYRVWPAVAAIPLAGPQLAEVLNGRLFVTEILEFSLGSGFILSVALMGAGCVLVIVPLMPIVFAEVRPPRTNRRCRNDGRWLSGIFRLLRSAALVLVFGVLLLPASGMALRALHALGLVPVSPEQFSTAAIVQFLGLTVAGTAAGFTAFRGRIKTLAGGFRAPVDVMLDVDGYLREHPRHRAPRARIFARYHSLLQFIASCGYTRVVVVAHSQGTVITADLLRYLKENGASPLASRTVTLFTMGSPLRQMYARRFPDLYAWVWRDGQPLRADTFPSAPDIESSAKPDPADLDLAMWVNAYRSGDYIGRWLWRSDDCAYAFSVSPITTWQSTDDHVPEQSRDPDGTRREFCIGAGAHTHYWDDTAPAIAVELDYLIRGDGAGGGRQARRTQP